MIVLRYDLIGAYIHGYKEHPQLVMKELGYNVLKFEGIPIGDCVMMEVEKTIEPLPTFIKLCDWKFTEVD